MATLIQRYDKKKSHLIFDPVQKRGTNWNFTGSQMPHFIAILKKGKRKVQGMPQSQFAALPRHQEEEETDKTKQAQIEQTYEKH